MSNPKNPNVCGVCGKPLTVPESIERGIGPVCFGHLFEIEPGNLQRSLIEPRFHYGIVGDVIWLEDLGGGQSLTNGMEHALRIVATSESIRISDFRICYRDSEGRWDGVAMIGNTASFYPIGACSRSEALNLMNPKPHYPNGKQITVLRSN
jgi:hypothetical protein